MTITPGPMPTTLKGLSKSPCMKGLYENVCMRTSRAIRLPLFVFLAIKSRCRRCGSGFRLRLSKQRACSSRRERLRPYDSGPGSGASSFAAGRVRRFRTWHITGVFIATPDISCLRQSGIVQHPEARAFDCLCDGSWSRDSYSHDELGHALRERRVELAWPLSDKPTPTRTCAFR